MSYYNQIITPPAYETADLGITQVLNRRPQAVVLSQDYYGATPVNAGAPSLSEIDLENAETDQNGEERRTCRR